MRARPALVLRRLFLACVFCEFVLVLLDLLVARSGVLGYPPLAHVFDVTSESSLGNFFSSVQALGVGLVLWLIRCRVRLEGRLARWRRRAWGALALFFLYLGVDDGVMLHERIGSYASQLGGPWFHRIESFFGSYSWQLALGPFLAIAGLLMLFFLWRVLRRPALLLCMLAFGCYLLAVGLDHLEGRSGSLTPLVPLLRLGIDQVQHGVRLIEELLEMLGTTLFLIGFLGHLLELTPRLELELAEEGRVAKIAASSDDCRPPVA